MMEEASSVSDEEKNAFAAAGGLYPMYFGASCAFVALHLLSRARGPDLDGARRCHLGDVLLQGSARLLGLLFWRSQRGKEALEESLRAAESEVSELKRLRTEDAKANEKVAGIFASHEQTWIAEKKKLKLETQAVLSQFRLLEAHKEEAVPDSNSRVEEEDRVIRSKEAALEEEVRKRAELEERLRAAEAATDETRERARKEAQDHAAELWKHKTAFAELVSNHRQLEAEMGRALRQVEAARQELDEASEQKEDAVAMVEQLSEDVTRMQRDAEQKAKVLSAMLRKSKIDAAERQVLLKEVRMSKAREKQAVLEAERLKEAVLEAERLRTRWEPRQRKGPLLPQFVEAESSHNRGEDPLSFRSGFHDHGALLLDYFQAEGVTNGDCVSPGRGDIVAGSDSPDKCSIKDSEEDLLTADVRQLQDWVHTEIEKCTYILQQRHYAEVEAFTEQMRLKDEKLEAYRWRVLSMELESKRLHSHIEGLDVDLATFREESTKLDALLLEKEQELKSLREELGLHMRQCRKGNSGCSAASSVTFDAQALWSEVRIVKREDSERWQELEATSDEGLPPAVETWIPEGGDWKGGAIGGAKHTHTESQHDEENYIRGSAEPDLETASSAASAPFTDQREIHGQNVKEAGRRDRASVHQEQGTMPVTGQAPQEAAEEEKEVSVDPGHAQWPANVKLSGASEVPNRAQASGLPSVSRDSAWKVDLHALGISYKIKRLKQQLLMLEKMAGAQHVGEKPVENEQQPKGLLRVVLLLNKQVKRYQSLEEKADDLCNRMESDREGSGPCHGRTKEETEALGGFLEEAFQLQRHIVATGQKLAEVQSRLAGSVVAGGGEGGHPPGLNAAQFADVARALFREIQRGFEVRVARIIGSLEGTLARDGILHIRS